MDKLSKDEQKLEKDIVTRVHKVRGQLQSLTTKDDPKSYAELTSELQACIGALEAIKKLYTVEELRKAVDALNSRKYAVAKEHLDGLLSVIARKSTDI